MSNSEFRVKGSHNYNRSSVMAWIISHLMRYFYLPIIAIITAILASVANGYIQFLVGDGFDLISMDINNSSVVNIVICIVICALLEGVFSFVNNSSLQIIGETLERDIKEEYISSLLSKNQTFFVEHSIGEILANITNDVSSINVMFSPGILLISEALMAIIMPIILIGVLNIRLLIVPIIYLVIWSFEVIRYNKKLYKVSEDLNYQYGVVNAIATESVSNIELVKGYVQEKQEYGKFKKAAKVFRDYSVKEGKIEGKFIPNLVYTVCLAGAFFYGIILFNNGVITVGELITFLGLFLSFEHANSLSSYSFVLFQLGIAGATRILEIINYTVNIDENENGVSKEIKGDIKFKNVSYEVDGNKILDNINFEIKAGQTVAVVGKTGSGKTILTQLMNRIFDATEGNVYVDDVDVKSWSLESLRSQISYLEQGVFLFSKSIFENITFSKQNADIEEVEKAAHIAQVDEFINSLPNKYSTVLTEGGNNLSGGQKQRIALARAILADSKILILDDFTSAVDSETDSKINEEVSKLGNNYTKIIITNRLNKVKEADMVLVMKRGKLVGKGTHKELLESCKEYKKMFF